MTTEEFIKEYKEELKNPEIQKPTLPNIGRFIFYRVVPIAIIVIMASSIFYWFTTII